MITQEFREWAENIKESVKICLGDLADIILEENKDETIDEYPLVIYIVVKSNGLRTHMMFDQSEYDNNDKEQRRKLVKVRCTDVAWSINCEIDELIKVRDALRRVD